MTHTNHKPEAEPAAVLAEREACANIAISAEDSALFLSDDARQVARYIADRIRARSTLTPDGGQT